MTCHLRLPLHITTPPFIVTVASIAVVRRTCCTVGGVVVRATAMMKRPTLFPSGKGGAANARYWYARRLFRDFFPLKVSTPRQRESIRFGELVAAIGAARLTTKSYGAAQRVPRCYVACGTVPLPTIARAMTMRWICCVPS